MKKFNDYITEMTDPVNSFKFPSMGPPVKFIMKKMETFYRTMDAVDWDDEIDLIDQLTDDFERQNVVFLNKKVAKSDYDKYYKYIISGGYYKGHGEIELVIKQRSPALRKYFMSMSRNEFLDPKKNRFLAELIFSYAHELIHRLQEKQRVKDVLIGKNKQDPYDHLAELQAGAFETVVSKKITGQDSPAMLIFTKRGNEVKQKFLELVSKIR